MKKSYKVGRVPSTYRKTETPMVTLGGQWLKDMGFEVGNEFQIINGKNMLILVKLTNNELQQRNDIKELQDLTLRIEELEEKYHK